jgi:hypothetical protein
MLACSEFSEMLLLNKKIFSSLFLLLTDINLIDGLMMKCKLPVRIVLVLSDFKYHHELHGINRQACSSSKNDQPIFFKDILILSSSSYLQKYVHSNVLE